ncbi:MAG: (d)CMP kinase [Deltaproteobacteria bacterium]|nr:(d)CMP kinase [Deltaproteobacteria bacterium]
MKRLIVAIDGPAGAGKSSVARAVAARLGMALVDTGAIYRCVALAAQRADIDWTDDEGLARLLPWLDIAFRFEDGQNRVFMRGEDVSEAIRSPEISKGASAVSALPVVRAGLLELQRRLARGAPAGAILEGRDIGTVVFPEADVKLFVTASDEVRAKRRQDELKQKGVDLPLDQVLADQKQRDHDDSTRDIAPLKPATDATLLDTSELPLDEVISKVAGEVERVRAR